MPPSQELPQLSNAPTSPQSVVTPLSAQQQTRQDTGDGTADDGAGDIDPKTGKRRLFDFNSKSPEDKELQKRMDTPAVGGLMPQTLALVNGMKQQAPDLRTPVSYTHLTLPTKRIV